MNFNEYKKTAKRLKCGMKYIRIGRTMLADEAEKIKTDKIDSMAAKRIDITVNTINNESSNFDKVIEDLKSENLIPGCQLSMFD